MPEDLTKHGFLPRCEGCAFNPQTDANRSDVTRLKARLCVEALEPFFCHTEVQEAVKNGLPYSEAISAVLRGCLEYIVKVEDVATASHHPEQSGISIRVVSIRARRISHRRCWRRLGMNQAFTQNKNLGDAVQKELAAIDGLEGSFSGNI